MFTRLLLIQLSHLLVVSRHVSFNRASYIHGHHTFVEIIHSWASYIHEHHTFMGKALEQHTSRQRAYVAGLSSMHCTVQLKPKDSKAQGIKGTASLQRQQKARCKRPGITSKAAKCNIEKARHHSKAATQVCVIAGVVHGTSWELEKVRGNGVMAMLTLAIISVVAALQVFGKDRLIFWRESESGESCCSYLPAQASGRLHTFAGCFSLFAAVLLSKRNPY